MPNAYNPEAIAQELGLEAQYVSCAVEHFDKGFSVPFIARYRLDQTGGLDEERLHRLREAVARAQGFEQRKASILRSLEAQGKLCDELRQRIEQADCLNRLDDLYLPFKPKAASSETNGQGLGPLAEEILSEAPSTTDLDARCSDFIDADKGVPDAATALAGAGRLLADRFSEDAELRRRVRSVVRKTGALTCRRTDGISEKKAEPYKGYFSYREPLTKTPPHRVLAIQRGERAKALAVHVDADEEAALTEAKTLLAPPSHTHTELLSGCAVDAVSRLLLPALREEARQELDEAAEAHSLEVFARNLRKLLLQPPLGNQRVLAIDPGYKNGCQLAALDESGALLATGKAAITGDSEAVAEGRRQLVALVEEHSLGLIAIGNGKGRNPTEKLIASLLAEEWKDREASYVIVNEAGAAAYASGPIAREELPDCDSPARRAVSIGRRLQDPLRELVKIDPASIGIGLYQHDAKAKPLRDALEEVVRSCVGRVGADLNTADASLLRYVPGLNPLSARRICEHRAKEGPFKNRAQLLEVSGVNEAAYQEAAGFLRVHGGDQPLDATAVHPESYAVAERLLSATGVAASELLSAEGAAKFREAAASRGASEWTEQLKSEDQEIGPLAVGQLIEALGHPGRDPRDDAPRPALRRKAVSFEELEKGLELQGTVLNVVDFGAFVDVGLSDSGLLHVSRMSSGFVSDPNAMVAVGDHLRVWVDSVDAEKRRVSLTLIDPTAPAPQRPKPNRRGKPQHRPVGKKEGANKRDKQAKKSGPGRKGGKRREHARNQGPRTYEARSKGPLKPLTREMEEGKEAMRSFGDLLQFHRKKAEGDDEAPEGDAGANG